MSAEARSRIMASIRSTDTKPEIALRRALWAIGLRGWRCQWRGPGGYRIDVAFTRWRVAVFADGVFWHGHPSKWQPGRWTGYWDEKIKRNIERDRVQDAALIEAGWTVLRFWDFEIERDAAGIAEEVATALSAGRASIGLCESTQDRPVRRRESSIASEGGADPASVEVDHLNHPIQVQMTARRAAGTGRPAPGS